MFDFYDTDIIKVFQVELRAQTFWASKRQKNTLKNFFGVTLGHFRISPKKPSHGDQHGDMKMT